MPSIRIAIIEDELLMAQVLGAWMVKDQDLVLVGSAQDGEAGWELCMAKQPDLALIDIELPKLDGLKLVERLLVEFPKMRLLSMSGLTDPYTIWQVSQCGVHGFIDKTQPPELLMQAVHVVAGGGTFFSPVFKQVKSEWLSSAEAFQKLLSDREQDILRRVVTGQADEKIGADLGITPATVATHRKHIRQKIGVHNDRGLVDYARRWGISIRRK